MFIRSSFWLGMAMVAFLILPSQALHYGLFDSSMDEILPKMGWANVNLSLTWFLPLCIFPLFQRVTKVKQRSQIELGFLCLWSIFIFVSAKLYGVQFGYAVFFLFITLIALATNSLSSLYFMRGDRFIIATLLCVLSIIAVFIVYPILAILSAIFGEYSQAFALLSQSYTFEIIINSLSVASVVAGLSTLFGLFFALYTTRIAKRSRFIGKFFSLLPLVTPPFVVGLGVTLMLGRSGYVTQFLMEYFGVSQNWLYGFKGIVLAHTLALTPMAFMLIEGALKSLNPALEEAACTLSAGRFQAFCTVTLPLLKPALANAFLIVMLQSLSDFSTPLVLGGNFDVISTQIYFYIAGMQLDYVAASTLGTMLLLFSLVVFVLQYLWLGKKSYVTVSGKASQGRFLPLPSFLQYLIILLLGIWVIFNIVLYGSIFYGSFTQNWGVNHTLTLVHYETLFGRGLSNGAFPSLIQTLIFALISAPLAALFGLLLAYLFVRLPFKGKRIFEFFTLLCFAVPGTVAGLSYVIAFNHSPIYLTGTVAIIIASMVTRNMPMGMRAAVAGLSQLDSVLDEASLTLKASRLKTLWYVVLPLLKPALLSAFVTSFVRAMTTVSAIIFLVTADTRVATSYILNRVEDGDYGLAVAYGSTLIVLMMGVILVCDKWLSTKENT